MAVALTPKYTLPSMKGAFNAIRETYCEGKHEGVPDGNYTLSVVSHIGDLVLRSHLLDSEPASNDDKVWGRNHELLGQI